jgi:hypothetical protein
MKLSRKYLNTHTFAWLFIVTGSLWLSACNVDLSGAAGLLTETPPVSAATEATPLSDRPFCRMGFD